MAKATTRAEVAALYSLIPPLPSRSPSALNPFYEKLAFSDPFSVAERPCEGDIQRAHQILYNERKAGKNPCGIKIEGIGQFS